jgi:hypothetical protein
LLIALFDPRGLQKMHRFLQELISTIIAQRAISHRLLNVFAHRQAGKAGI